MKDCILGCALSNRCHVVSVSLVLVKPCVVLSFGIINMSYNTPPDDFGTKKVFERAMAIEFYSSW